MVDIRWLGHSTFHVSGSKSVYIDPFLDGNPTAPITAADVTSADFVAVTHSHDDHLGQTFDICVRTDATLVSQYEIVARGQAQGVQKVEPMNIGGSVTNDGVTFHLVHAQHTCEWGDATGIIVELDGLTIYHVGDTGLFSDLKMIGELFDIDVMLCPIGDRFTMGPRSAAKAVEWVGPKLVVPMHYNTWPLVEADPSEFKALVGANAEVVIAQPGELIAL